MSSFVYYYKILFLQMSNFKKLTQNQMLVLFFHDWVLWFQEFFFAFLCLAEQQLLRDAQIGAKIQLLNINMCYMTTTYTQYICKVLLLGAHWVSILHIYFSKKGSSKELLHKCERGNKMFYIFYSSSIVFFKIIFMGTS